jgi:hypothetical protein
MRSGWMKRYHRACRQPRRSTPDPGSAMTRSERAELIDLLNKSYREFLEAVETVTDRQWSFKQGPDRWSIAEVAEHIVLSEAALFDNATKNVNGTADEKWDATLGKSDILRRALPNRSTKVTAPEGIQPKRGMTCAQLMARFKEQRARMLAYAWIRTALLREGNDAYPNGRDDRHERRAQRPARRDRRQGTPAGGRDCSRRRRARGYAARRGRRRSTAGRAATRRAGDRAPGGRDRDGWAALVPG